MPRTERPGATRKAHWHTTYKSHLYLSTHRLRNACSEVELVFFTFAEFVSVSAPYVLGRIDSGRYLEGGLHFLFPSTYKLPLPRYVLNRSERYID